MTKRQTRQVRKPHSRIDGVFPPRPALEGVALDDAIIEQLMLGRDRQTLSIRWGVAAAHVAALSDAMREALRRPRVPADATRAPARDGLDLTGLMLGDPAPGRSALDLRIDMTCGDAARRAGRANSDGSEG